MDLSRDKRGRLISNKQTARNKGASDILKKWHKEKKKRKRYRQLLNKQRLVLKDCVLEISSFQNADIDEHLNTQIK